MWMRGRIWSVLPTRRTWYSAWVTSNGIIYSEIRKRGHHARGVRQGHIAQLEASELLPVARYGRRRHNDLAIHDLDVQKYLAESDVASVMCLAGATHGSNFESHANILLEFSNGIIGHIETNWLTPSDTHSQPDVLREVRDDRLRQPDVRHLFVEDNRVRRPRLVSVPQEVSERMVYLKKEEPLKREIADFLEAVEHKKTPLVDGHDGIDALRIALAAIESFKKRTRINLE